MLRNLTHIYLLTLLLLVGSISAQTSNEVSQHRVELQPYVGYVTNRSFSGLERPVFISGDSLNTYTEIKKFQLSSVFQAGVQAIVFANKSFNLSAGVGYQQSSNSYRYGVIKGNDYSSPAVSSNSATYMDYHNTYHFLSFYLGARYKLPYHLSADLGITNAWSAHTKQKTEGYKTQDVYAWPTSTGPSQHFSYYDTYSPQTTHLDYVTYAASAQVKLNYDLPIQKIPSGVYVSYAYCINRVNAWVSAGIYARFGL